MVPGGTVGRGLLRDDPLAPFGWRLDHAKVLSAFEEEWAWPGESVVLVEASDLSRAAAYGGRSTPRQARALRDEALPPIGREPCRERGCQYVAMLVGAV